MRRILIAAGMLAGAAMPLAVQAQQSNTLTPRVEKLEKEMRAVQRKVFPGGGGQYFEAEIGANQPAATPTGNPASSPIADLTARVSALESQLQTLTGQTEQNAFKLRQLEEAFTKFRTETEGRLNPAPVVTPTAAPAASAAPKPATPTPKPAAASAATPKLPADRQAALDAIEHPATSDAGEDAYLYGYRLWDAKFYPQAQAQLKSTVEKYPKHKRWSFAQNLLGRAYLDDGKPALASVAFYDNYQKMPRGERAPDSLYYLGVALTRLKKLPDACKVFEEFDDVYGATASAGLKASVAKARTDAKCKTA